jgi:hypothetical protein
MKVTKKDLRKLIERLDGQLEDYPKEPFQGGYNRGIERATELVKELLDNLD